MKIKGRHLVYALILLVFGFIVSFSYQSTKSERAELPTTNEWKREDQLRTDVLSLQKINKDLREELETIQNEVRNKEEQIAEQEQTSFNLVEDLNKLRMVVGTVAVKGPGIKVTLADTSYIPDGENPNQYIVHEEHLRSVIYELLVTGAEAVAINGQRISHQTSIVCIGPVVSVDGIQHPAPFEIVALGDPEIFSSALNLQGNTVDQLVNEGIEVKLEKLGEIQIEPYLSREG
jgi:uncharacterized protein YlxW (UPF0749 family)